MMLDVFLRSFTHFTVQNTLRPLTIYGATICGAACLHARTHTHTSPEYGNTEPGIVLPSGLISSHKLPHWADQTWFKRLLLLHHCVSVKRASVTFWGKGAHYRISFICFILEHPWLPQHVTLGYFLRHSLFHHHWFYSSPTSTLTHFIVPQMFPVLRTKDHT